MKFELKVSIMEAIALGTLIGTLIGILTLFTFIPLAVTLLCAVYLFRDKLFKKRKHWDPYTKSEVD